VCEHVEPSSRTSVDKILIVVHRAVHIATRTLVWITIAILIILGAALAILETSWTKDRIRDLIVRQANEYLAATLSIGRLEGSLLAGLTLGDIRLTRDGHTLVSIDELSVRYSIRELVQAGTVIKRVRLVRPHVVLSKLPDGRWDIAAIVKREQREGPRSGPSRPIEVQSIEIDDGHIELRDPIEFGAAHVPTDYQSLNAVFAFQYVPVRWQVDFTRASWIGNAPELSIADLSGSFGDGPQGFFFNRFSVDTPRSSFMVDGRIVRGDAPTHLDLRVRATQFAFQEWSGIIHGLKNIAVDAAFETTLSGPLAKLETDLQLRGTGGSVRGRLTLDTTVPGWHANGVADVAALNLAPWMNNGERQSDITGKTTFNLALRLGEHFPRGAYAFDGAHAMYMGYVADRVKASGDITDTTVLVASATATAYGAGVVANDSSICLDSPFPYRFRGTVTQIDLRNVPERVPVPRVESTLTFDYDVNGQFSQPFIAGQAAFASSTFLGASIGAGASGRVDSSATPIAYAGDGDLSNVDLERFARDLDLAWLKDPRYAGSIAGHFHVDGHGADRAALSLDAGGHLDRGRIFHGSLSDAELTLHLQNGTLDASYSGRFAGLDPSVALNDSRWRASLTGAGTVAVTTKDLLTSDTVTLNDYTIAGAMTLTASSARDVPIDHGTISATLSESRLAVTNVDLTSPVLHAHGDGTVALDDHQPSSFTYRIARADLGKFSEFTGQPITGALATSGQITGPSTALHAVGQGNVMHATAYGTSVLDVSGKYDAHVSTADLRNAAVTFEGHATGVALSDQRLDEIAGQIGIVAQTITANLQVRQIAHRDGTVIGTARLNVDNRNADVSDLTIGLGRAMWQLQTPNGPVRVGWSDQGVSVAPATLVGPANGRIGVAGTWRRDGSGELRFAATRVSLDSLQPATARPNRYGGTLDVDGVLRGTRDHPVVSSTVSITNGRVERVSYQKLGGRLDFANREFTVDLRLDQSPNVWITAAGKMPLTPLGETATADPLDVTIVSSNVDLGLIAGLTDAVHNVNGQLQMNLHAVGTGRDPHFIGAVAINGAAFDVGANGAKYRNGRVNLTLTSDRIAVDAFRIEDNQGHALELHGSVGTHELRVGDLEIAISAQRFEVLRNMYGRTDLDASLQLRGRFDAPQLSGEMTIGSGDLKVDEILQRAIFQPYDTEQTTIIDVGTETARSTWQMLGMNLTLHVPNTLRLSGDNVQLSPGTPIGLGDINLRVGGDLYLYKDPHQPLYVTGSFDTMSGTYAFQGRRFDIDPTSSIVFRGDLSPELYVGVTRTISGVDTRVGIIGPMTQPELRLSSIPSLSQSDILSLIVFNTSTNELNASQQQDLVVRAGALATGFLAAPIVSALSREIGLDILEVQPASDIGGSVGAKVTVGQEIAPGLVARFSHQFGIDAYDEATIEYYLSRIIRLRATFSDAQALMAISPFRRIERAGIDLLFFFSF